MYKLAYKLLDRRSNPMTKEELQKEDLGGCDAIIIHSILFPPDGSRNELLLTFDSNTGQELSDNELFKSMIILAERLSRSETLPSALKSYCTHIWECVRQAVLSKRETNESEKTRVSGD